MDALKYASILRQEEMHLNELGISTLSALFCNQNRDPKKGEPSRPSDFWYFKSSEEKEVQISYRAADCFFSLISDEIIPGWALGILPLEQLRKAKKGEPVPRPRAWVGEGALLLLPEVEGTAVRSPLVALDGVSGMIPVVDIDTGTTFMLSISTDDRRWAIDAEIELQQI